MYSKKQSNPLQQPQGLLWSLKQVSRRPSNSGIGKYTDKCLKESVAFYDTK